MKLELFPQIFDKFLNIKFNENPSSGAELFHADWRTYMTKLIVVFRYFANAPKNSDSPVLLLIAAGFPERHV
jgi:hypothetical protein